MCQWHAVCLSPLPCGPWTQEECHGCQDHIDSVLQGLKVTFCGELECFNPINAPFSVAVKDSENRGRGFCRLSEYTQYSSPLFRGPWGNSELRLLMHSTGTWREPSRWNAMAYSNNKWSFSMVMPTQRESQCYSCRCFVHPTFRMNLTPCDFHLIRSLNFEGKHFWRDDKVISSLSFFCGNQISGVSQGQMSLLL